MAGQKTQERMYQRTAVVGGKHPYREPQRVPEYDQLDRAELRGMELAERTQMGEVRNTVDECAIQLRRLRRSVSERADHEIDRMMAYKAFMKLAEVAAKGMAQLQPGTLPVVKS